MSNLNQKVPESQLLERALLIINDLTLFDKSDCDLDHEGFCQSHNWFSNVTRCPSARAKDLLVLTGFRCGDDE